uniref:Uncharacterized protein n=1 Tax=Dulem virus 42 TaxID=3145760 RepID=A0AAU8B7L9_9CAUD
MQQFANESNVDENGEPIIEVVDPSQPSTFDMPEAFKNGFLEDLFDEFGESVLDVFEAKQPVTSDMLMLPMLN